MEAQGKAPPQENCLKTRKTPKKSFLFPQNPAKTAYNRMFFSKRHNFLARFLLIAGVAISSASVFASESISDPEELFSVEKSLSQELQSVHQDEVEIVLSEGVEYSSEERSSDFPELDSLLAETKSSKKEISGLGSKEAEAKSKEHFKNSGNDSHLSLASGPGTTSKEFPFFQNFGIDSCGSILLEFSSKPAGFPERGSLPVIGSIGLLSLDRAGLISGILLSNQYFGLGGSTPAENSCDSGWLVLGKNGLSCSDLPSGSIISTVGEGLNLVGSPHLKRLAGHPDVGLSGALGFYAGATETQEIRAKGWGPVSSKPSFPWGTGELRFCLPVLGGVPSSGQKSQGRSRSQYEGQVFRGVSISWQAVEEAASRSFLT